jgi:hypothetical protein
MSECIFTQSDEGICYSHQQPAALCSIAADALRAERDSLLQAATLYCHLHPPQLGGDDLQPLRDALTRAEGK